MVDSTEKIHISRSLSPDFRAGRETELLDVVYTPLVARKLGFYTPHGFALSDVLSLLDIDQRLDGSSHMALTGSPRRVLANALTMRRQMPGIGKELSIEDRAQIREASHALFERLRSNGEEPLIDTVTSVLGPMGKMAVGKDVQIVRVTSTAP